MGDIALRGNKLTAGRRAGFQSGKRVGHKRTGNTQRENRLEELGRVDAEKAWTRHGKRDLRLEKHRIRDELKTGGRVGLKKGGKPWGTGPKPGTHEFLEHHLHKPRKGKATGGAAKKVSHDSPLTKWFQEKHGGTKKKKPHSTQEGRIAAGKRALWRGVKEKEKRQQMGPGAPARRTELKKGGKADKKWMQKVSASIKKRGTKGKCTPITKPGCTGKAKALAKTFKKIAAKRKA